MLSLFHALYYCILTADVSVCLTLNTLSNINEEKCSPAVKCHKQLKYHLLRPGL